jgi:ADP-heptose:LPS heptosyltransferase
MSGTHGSPVAAPPPSAGAATFWQRCNRALYAAWYRARALRAQLRPRLRLPAPAAAPPALLVVAWGRIGDLVLASGVLQHFRAAFAPWRIAMLARPEVAPVVGPWVDELHALDPRAWRRDPAYRAALGRALAREWEAVLGDVHLFYGGVHALRGLLEALPARARLHYEGYHLGRDLAPARPVPAGFDLIARAPRADGSLDARHVTRDCAHWFQQALARLRPDRAAAFAGADLRPSLPRDPLADEAVARAFGLQPGVYVTCQPLSNNPRKDWPASRWLQACAAFPNQPFVWLGTARERQRLGDVAWPRNVIDLMGRTSLPQTLALLGAGGGHAGGDSGLAHVAAVLGKPTLCVAAASNLGYFFPYPVSLGIDKLRVVHAPEYAACSGCFMVCRHEPIWRTARRGALCLRDLPATAVIEAMAEHLG